MTNNELAFVVREEENLREQKLLGLDKVLFIEGTVSENRSGRLFI